MKAMILAAGLGTRLRPLTDTRPKALVEINGRTLLEITLSRLRSFGVTEAIINVHHFADMVIAYLKSHNNFGMRIEISREDDLLLDTGGGLKKAAWFFLEHSQRTAKKKQGTVIPSAGDERRSRVPTPVGRNPGKASTQSNSDQKPDASGNADEPFLLHNVDVISTIDFRRMLQFHTENRALATLAVQARASSRLLLFNDQLRLCGRRIDGKDTLIPIPPDTAIPIPYPAVIPSSENAVISSEARNLSSPSGDASPHSSDAVAQAFRPEESAFSSHSPLATRHSFTPSEAEGPLPSALAFSGIHVISPRLLRMLTEEGVFSIIDAYLRLAAQGEKIFAFRADEYYWRDLGRPSDLSQAALDLQQRALL
jgi:NDP-sugar pyrophosphorylase family protein